MKKMTILFICLSLMTLTMNAQTLKSFFDKYSNEESVEYVSLNNASGIIKEFGKVTEQQQNMISKIKGLKILSLSSDIETQKKALKELGDILKKNKFETFLEAVKKDDKVYFYNLTDKNNNTHIVMVVQDKTELSIIWFDGKLPAQELIGIMGISD